MDLKLMKIFVVFYQHTKILDIQSIKEYIKNEIYNVGECSDIDMSYKKEDGYPQHIVSFSPMQTLIFDKEIQFSLNLSTFPGDYDDFIDTFFEMSRKFSNIVSLNGNICGRIGIVNTSFLQTNNQDDIVQNKYLKEIYKDKIIDISLSYTNILEFKGMQVNKINSIYSESVMTPQKEDGIIIRSDINISAMQEYIHKENIENFIEMSLRLLDYNTMKELIYG